MPEQNQEYPPTTAALLELQEERDVVREGHRFMDEKRLLLASEALRQIDHYDELRSRYQEVHREALEALRKAAARHGLDGLEVHPAQPLHDAAVSGSSKSFLGVRLVHAEWARFPAIAAPPTVDPSPEARRCAGHFHELLHLSLEMAAVTSNMERLLAEYRRTERRTRALEDVILPEVEAHLHDVRTRLEELDQEEAIRVRTGAGRRESR